MVTASEVLELLHNLGYNDITLDDKRILDEGKLNSLGLMSLISAIEMNFGCMVDPSDLLYSSFESCESIADLINKSIEQQS